MSIDTDSIQYENDDIMRPMYGDDYCIACCVSAMAVGKQMQFFGARANLAKSLLYAINGGVDEKKGLLVIPEIQKDDDEVLDYPKVLANYKKVLSYVAELYVDTINIIHFMHDKYAYESSQMALHDTLVERSGRLRRGGSFHRCRLPLRHQVRQGDARSAMKTALRWISSPRATSPSTAMTMTGWTISPWRSFPTSLPS